MLYSNGNIFYNTKCKNTIITGPMAQKHCIWLRVCTKDLKVSKEVKS